MSEDLITSENISRDFLKSLFDAAYMDTSFDNDGDLVVIEDIRCFVIPNMERKNQIQLLTQFSFKASSNRLQRLECVNKINRELTIVKAYTQDSNNNLSIGYDICIEGGLPKKTFMLAFKRFCSIPRHAVLTYGADVVE